MYGPNITILRLFWQLLVEWLAPFTRLAPSLSFIVISIHYSVHYIRPSVLRHVMYTIVDRYYDELKWRKKQKNFWGKNKHS